MKPAELLETEQTASSAVERQVMQLLLSSEGLRAPATRNVYKT